MVYVIDLYSHFTKNLVYNAIKSNHFFVSWAHLIYFVEFEVIKCTQVCYYKQWS